jgi:hypothetical protein
MRRHLPTPSASPSRRWATTLGAAALVAALGAPAAVASDCDPLVSHTPTGSDGDTAAVAITSQTLSADVEGWERVGWQAADETAVTAVTLVREDGTEHRTDGDLATGMAEHVLEVRFCGTQADAAEAPSAEAEVVQVTAADETAAGPAEEPADDPVEIAEEPEPTAPAETQTTDDPAPASEADETDEADAAPAPTHPGDEHESDGPQRVVWGDDTGTTDSEVEQATLAAVVQEPAAPLAGGTVGLLAGLVVVAGAQRRRPKEERR